MKKLYLLLTLLGLSCTAQSQGGQTYLIKQKGCQFGAEIVAAFAVQIESTVSEIISKTEPNSVARKKQYQDVVDSSEKMIDKVYIETKRKKEEQLNDPTNASKSYYEKISYEANLSMYYMSVGIVYKIGVASALQNASQNKKFSEARYLRHVESECLSVSDKK